MPYITNKGGAVHPVSDEDFADYVARPNGEFRASTDEEIATSQAREQAWRDSLEPVKTAAKAVKDEDVIIGAYEGLEGAVKDEAKSRDAIVNLYKGGK